MVAGPQADVGPVGHRAWVFSALGLRALGPRALALPVLDSAALGPRARGRAGDQDCRGEHSLAFVLSLGVFPDHKI
ncbi:MAG: hypothetical protein ACI8UD_000184 [Planctomycetota bacterium]|jgi:hypothetical protein